jgi:type II secretory pathway component GspD/PulD (secretin)
MNRVPSGCIAAACVLTVLLAAPATAQTPSPTASAGGMPIGDFITAIAKKTGKKVIVEPRVQATVSVAPDPARLSYDDFLNVLMVHGFVAVERGDTMIVVPDGGARTLPVPLVSGNEKRPDAEVVTRIIRVRNIPAASVVPLLRPLIPQYGHLAANVCTNDLILVDRFANAKRLEQIVQALDTGQPYKPENCAGTTPAKVAGD